MDRHAKLRAVACRFWAIPPWEFDAACEQGKVTYADLVQLISVVAHDPTQWMMVQWLFPEAAARQKQQEILNKHEAALEKALAFATPTKG